jgi:hypothetical protein
MNIQLPTKKGQPNTTPNIDFDQLVIIGANGAGKTRFGSNIESRYIRQTHRISAQKSLSFPKEVSPKSKKRAEIEFLSGYYYENQDAQFSIDRKGDSRWKNNFNTFLLDDYEKLLVLLHTEEYEEALNYKEGRTNKPTTKLDRVQRIWELVLPHRKLHKIAGVIQAYPSDQEATKYNASEMSDGERVIFYLAGEVVCTPQNSIIIIDEPEMHIHSSLIKPFFDLIEAERPDCSFIYLTHNIDFAFTRQNTKKIWAKGYEGNNVWDYEILDETMPIPEQLYLDVLGSRKPILFLEGDSSSSDYALYEQVYSDFTIKPLGSCEKVMHCVKSFNEQNTFHHIDSLGLIDRDRMSDSEIVKLNANKIWVLDVAEVENLFLLENIVKSVASYMGKSPDDVLKQVKQNLFGFFQTQIESQVLLSFKDAIRKKHLELVNFNSKNIQDVINEIDAGYASLNKQQMFDAIKVEYESVLQESNYEALLRLFNLKNALIPKSGICELTGIKNKESYKNIVLTLLKKNDQVSQIIKDAINDRIIKNAT